MRESGYMNMNEQMRSVEEKSTLWSRRKFLKASLISTVATAGFFVADQSSKVHAISSPETISPFRNLQKNNEASADVGTGAGFPVTPTPSVEKQDIKKDPSESNGKDLNDFLQWTPKEISAYLKKITPIRWSDGKLVQWGITKTSQSVVADEFVFSGIYHGFGKDHVATLGRDGKHYEADLSYLLLLVPTRENDALLPTKFYLFQNMETTGILGYNMIDPEKNMLPTKRGLGGSMNDVPLKNEQLAGLKRGVSVAVVSPSSALTFTDAELQKYYETKPEAVVAILKNGEANASYKMAQQHLSDQKSASIYAADWIFISNTPPKQN